MSDDVADPGLWGCYIAFMRAALAFIGKRQSGKPAPMRLRTRVRHRDASIAEFEREQEPDVFMMVARHCGALERLPEFQSLYRYIASSTLADCVFVDAGNNPIKQARTQSWWLMNLYAVPLLTKYIGPGMVMKFEEGRAKSVYTGLEAFLESGQVSYSIVAPLEGFEGPDQEVQLGTTSLLRKLREDEIEYLWDLSESGGIVERHQVLTMTCGLETADAPTNSQVEAQLIAAVTALRLLKPGRVGVPLLVRHPREPAFGATSGYATSGPSPASMGPSYVLTWEDAQELIPIYDALVSTTLAQRLDIPLNRFNYAYQRTRPDDRLIDYWVALEALFLKRDEQQESTYKAALRIARFLGEDPGHRVTLFETMKKSYNARSRVVHGDPLPRDIADTTASTEEVLRKALRSSVLSGSVPDPDKLDLDAVRADLKE